MVELINMEKTAEISEDEMFVFIVHGFTPEFYTSIAFRIDKSLRPKRMKNVICPYCGEVFETIDAQTKIRVFRTSKSSAATYHRYRQCKICRSAVALKFA